MRYILRKIIWFFKAWPVLIPILAGILHYSWLQEVGSDYQQTNKLVSLILQLIGGLLVLYSIDSNIAVIKNSGVLRMALNWAKAPFIKRSNTIIGKAAFIGATSGVGTVRVSVSAKTTEEKLEHLQQQIHWLKNDINIQNSRLNENISKLKIETTSQHTNITQELKQLESNMETVSVGGVKIQVLGVLFVIHGSISGYFA